MFLLSIFVASTVLGSLVQNVSKVARLIVRNNLASAFPFLESNPFKLQKWYKSHWNEIINWSLFLATWYCNLYFLNVKSKPPSSYGNKITYFSSFGDAYHFPHHNPRQGFQWPRGLEKFSRNIPSHREIVWPHLL